MPPVALHFSVFTGASCSLGHILVFVFLSAPVASSLWMQSAAPWFGLHALSVSLGFSPFTHLSQQALQALLISSSICIRRWVFSSTRKIVFTPHCLLSFLSLELPSSLLNLSLAVLRATFLCGFFLHVCPSMLSGPLPAFMKKKAYFFFLIDFFHLLPFIFFTD